MSTRFENANNHKYIFQYKNDPPSRVITYRNNLIKNIQSHRGSNNESIKNFNANSVDSEKFERFIEIARSSDFTVYQVRKL